MITSLLTGFGGRVDATEASLLPRPGRVAAARFALRCDGRVAARRVVASRGAEFRTAIAGTPALRCTRRACWVSYTAHISDATITRKQIEMAHVVHLE
ncbi:MAG TPA: hypothetical protein VN541_19760 [Tepidisphaeraceae bacterium]|nr:hypothetical protein [Tepidisphaeraceae bacterium]